jgi:hypothetical protein
MIYQSFFCLSPSRKYRVLLYWQVLNFVVFIAVGLIKPLMPELNPSAQCYLARFFTGDFNF